MTLNGNTKKFAGWSAAISIAVGVLVLWDKGGAFVEPAVTKVITEKVKTVAKRHDDDQKLLIREMNKMKTELSAEMTANNREQIRLIVEALRREGRTP